MLTNALGNICASGKYTTVHNWLESYANKNVPTVNLADKRIGIDNEQKEGKSWTAAPPPPPCPPTPPPQNCTKLQNA